jgi:hypothetical protein
MSAEPDAAELQREQAIVDEAIAAIQATPATGTDHPGARRRVRVVIEAIRAAR